MENDNLHGKLAICTIINVHKSSNIECPYFPHSLQGNYSGLQWAIQKGLILNIV